MSATAIKLIIKLWHDDCPEEPGACDDWKAYSFSTRHSNYRDPESIFEEDDDGNYGPDEELQKKLDSGLAFFLDYFEHGQCMWSLAGEGPQCRWDTSRTAGLLVWEQDEESIGAKTVEDRRKDAKAFIERYTQWCNGEVYGYTVEAVTPCPTCGQVEETDEVDFDLPSCGGYYPDDIEYMVANMKDHIGEGWEDYEVEFVEHPYASGMADEVKRFWKEEA
jgi:hypothetical protein